MGKAGLAAVLAAALAAQPALAFAQYFGQNQVRLRAFDWKAVDTPHFRIHYYEGSAGLVRKAAAVLERSYSRNSKTLGVTWDVRKPFFLYANVNDMEQSTIVDVGDGTGGVTEPFKDRFMAYNDGTLQWFDTVITHELTHVFQYHVLMGGFWRSGRILKSIVYPLWFVEGMAEFCSNGLEQESEELIVRDAATSGGLIPLWKLEHFSHLKPHQVRLAYDSGERALEFLEREYGEGSVARMLKLFDSRFETSAVLADITGLDVFAFDKKWREYEEERARREVRLHRLREPESYGPPLTRSKGGLPEFNSSPVVTPDGRTLAWLSTRDGYPPQVMTRDLKMGKTRVLMRFDTRIETVMLGNFTNLSHALSVSPDGKTLAFTGTKNHRDSLWLCELATGRLRRIELPGLMTATQPAFHPDGRRVAFSGMKDGVTDLWMVDTVSGQLNRLTDDPQDDQTPWFSPDGSWLVYSSEAEVPGSRMLYQRRLRRLDLATGASTTLLDIPGAPRDPAISADGKRVLFSLEAGGDVDLHELDLATGKTARLTRTIGGAYAPFYAPDGDVVFSAMRGGSVQLFKVPRARLDGDEPASAEGPATWDVAGSTTASAPFHAPSPYSTDLFLPAFFYSSNGGVFWTSYYQGSDMFGEHNVTGLVSYASGLGYLDYQGQYDYRHWRTDLTAGAGGFNHRGVLDPDTGATVNQSVHQQFIAASRPFDRYDRADLSLASVMERDRSDFPQDQVSKDARMASAELVRDTVRGRYLVATAGGRLRAGYSVAPRVLGGNSVREGVFGEAQRFVPTGGLSALALRLQSAGFWGPDAPQYILGGLGGVRGYGRSSTTDAGLAGAVATAEWRVPVLPNLDYYMWYIFPDFYFKMLSMSLFTDAGRVWSTRGELGESRWSDVRQSYGVGLSLETFILQLFPLTINFDYARRTRSNGGVFYVYLGPLF